MAFPAGGATEIVRPLTGIVRLDGATAEEYGEV